MPDRENLAIGWSDVDLDAATVDVCWRLVRRTTVGLLLLPSTNSGRKGERLIPLPSWAITMLKRRRFAIGPGVEAIFPRLAGRLARSIERAEGVAAGPGPGRDRRLRIQRTSVLGREDLAGVDPRCPPRRGVFSAARR
jgi:integrase